MLGNIDCYCLGLSWVIAGVSLGKIWEAIASGCPGLQFKFMLCTVAGYCLGFVWGWGLCLMLAFLGLLFRVRFVSDWGYVGA